jgi:hypothetical protein
MPERKSDDRLTIRPDDETSRLNARKGQAEPLDPVADRSGDIVETGTPEPDDSYQSREGYHDLGGGFLPDDGEPNDEPEITEEGE